MMTSTIIWTIAVIAILGLVLAVVLYVVAEKFKVEEDPRIEEVEKVMLGANCGGCGFAGCHAFAEAAVKAPNLDKNFCPVGQCCYAEGGLYPWIRGKGKSSYGRRCAL